MNEQVIPAEAVEAAARTTFNRTNYVQWEDLSEFDRIVHRGAARAALEAAAPYIIEAARKDGTL